MSWTAPQTWTTGQSTTAANFNQQIRDNLLYLYGAMDNLIAFWADKAIVTAGGFTNSNTIDATHPYEFYLQQTPQANANAMNWGFIAQAGINYILSVLGFKSVNGAAVDWSIDGVNVLTGQDWYAAGSTVNVVQSGSGITIASSGYHVLLATVHNHNVASGGYRMAFTQMWLKPATF